MIWPGKKSGRMGRCVGEGKGEDRKTIRKLKKISRKNVKRMAS